MIAAKVTAEVLRQAAESIGVRADINTINQNGTRHRVKLYPDAWEESDPAERYVMPKRCAACGSKAERRDFTADGRMILFPCGDAQPRYALKARKGERGNRKYQRISASTYNDRRVYAVCWHGFRDYFRAVYALAPDAVFNTAFDRWKGSQDFEERYRSSGHRNVGSQMAPRCAAEVCACPESGMAV